ncbi:MAG: hypothetical protein COV02_01550 [Candidatus Terrybacteria bacterium CG10_big_fil_rev_8_21_14_0_10_41_10]|uniref:Excinuclease ABC subunit C n=1 Tax=Candidatus Terrybacteria bacterium CG10_big_fil_rev_8_21_14_0_10_41_10 TaxID=1975026 RepID=A0A2M8LAI7_9BACT|nr:MAG: hypothetical protein COV02_01550 [Candidatus Terrybacteria bacterium CG10_big_fil_rev_8_21_14_0_10_41_10]
MSIILNQVIIKKLPNAPGVYMFLDKKGVILYVGRATSLKNRVASYFRNDIPFTKKEMVSLAAKIKHIETEMVIDSVVLEANLIKKHWPKYNVKDKDNRSFSYIVLDKGDYPAPIVARARELKKFPSSGFKIFGPYGSSKIAGDVLRIIRKIFPYSLDGGPKPDLKPCFHRQIGLCPGVCSGEISKKDYKKIVSNLVLFLSGKKKRLLNKLAKESPEKAKALRYLKDAALMIREEETPLGDSSRIEGYDISHFAGRETYGSMVVFENGEENKKEYRLFKIKEAGKSNDLESLKEVVERRFKHEEWRMPDIVMIDGGRPQVIYISRVLKNIGITAPVVGVSKYAGDELVFPSGAKKSFKDLAQASKNILLRTRDEAHRFARSAHRRARGRSLHQGLTLVQIKKRRF